MGKELVRKEKKKGGGKKKPSDRLKYAVGKKIKS